MSIKVTYKYVLNRFDTPNFHGWVIFECSDGLEELIYSSTSLKEAKAFLHDLTGE